MCDNISCSSHQSANEFLKECSPYEEMEQPDSWDCDNDAVQPEDNKEDTLLTGSLSCSHETILEGPTPKSEVDLHCEEGSEAHKSLAENDLKHEIMLETVIPQENEAIELYSQGQQQASTDKVTGLEEQQCKNNFILY